MTPLQKLREWVYSIDVTMVSTDVLLEKIEQLMPEEREGIEQAWNDHRYNKWGNENTIVDGKHYFTQKYGSNAASKTD